MLADPLQHIDEVGVGIDTKQATGYNQTLRDTDVFGTELGPTEVLGFAPHQDRTQCALQMVGIEQHTSGSVRNTSSPRRRSRAYSRACINGRVGLHRRRCG